MSADTLWTTGITVKYDSHQDKWTAGAKFYDGRFCDDQAVQGTLDLRYWVSDLTQAIELIRQLTARLRIQEHFPKLYVEHDGEEGVDLPENWREILHQEAEKIGWETYALT